MFKKYKDFIPLIAFCVFVGILLIVPSGKSEKKSKPLSMEQKAQFDCVMKELEAQNKFVVESLKYADLFSVQSIIIDRRREEASCMRLAQCSYFSDNKEEIICSS